LCARLDYNLLQTTFDHFFRAVAESSLAGVPSADEATDKRFLEHDRFFQSLANRFTTARTLSIFERRLDAFWRKHQDVLCKIKLTGVRSRSQINANDNTITFALFHWLFFVCTSWA